MPGGIVIADPRGGHVWIYGVDGSGDPVKLLVDADGHLQVTVLATELPTGAATEVTLSARSSEATLELARVLLASLDGKDFATQVTLAALLAELEGKADLAETQPVSAAGGDKLFSLESVVQQAKGITAVAGTNDVDSDVVPTGKVWVITAVVAWSDTAMGNDLWIGPYTAGGVFVEVDRADNPTAYSVLKFHGHVCLAAGDVVRARFYGAVGGESLSLRALGYQMDAPG